MHTAAYRDPATLTPVPDMLAWLEDNAPKPGIDVWTEHEIAYIRFLSWCADNGLLTADIEG